MKILMRLNIGILGGITAGIIAIALLGACEEIIEPGDCAPPTILDEANNACVMPQSSCDPDAPTSIADECVAAHRLCQELAGEALCGVCEPSHIEVDGECVLLSTCEGLDCAAQKRECVTIDDTVSAYCGECVEGSVDLGGSCVTQSCDEHTPASIGAACDSAFRVCTESATGAVCGGCFEYYVEQNDFCLPVQRCVDLGCLDAHRFCVEALSHTDAACVECKVGYIEENGVCLLDDSATCVADVEGSILDGCAAENRNCVTLSGVSSCSGCKSGFVENEALATCELPATCSELSCDTLNRSCEEIPNGHCVGCLPDFIEDEATLLCRPVLVCDDMSCSDGDECAAATQESDAFCRKECAGNALWSGSRCVQCPPCDAEGEVGPWPWPTATGACICQTEPGYYYSLSADVGPFKCDSDGDGWLRESARISLESSDAALLANARCNLRTVDRFILENEQDERYEVMLDMPLPLYETDRNDDDIILNAIWNARGFPDYGKRVKAKELNRLTKICHDLRMDYNDNGAADVEEWGVKKLGPAMRPEQQAFNVFSYFTELNQGRYESGSVGAEFGRYVVSEKSRLEGDGTPSADRVPLQYKDDDGAYWRECELGRDSEWEDAIPPIGMDFAEFKEDGFVGMKFHGMFKCLIVDEDPDGGIPTELSPATISAFDYRLNRCVATAESVVNTDNPDEQKIECDLVDVATVQAGDILWGATPYLDHGQWAGAEFSRGCVNECIEALPLCPGYDLNPHAIDCTYDVDNFGKFVQCEAWELCDGLDNTGDGETDEGDPEGGIVCETDGLGACTAGLTHCVGGEIVCTQDNTPLGELCDGIDNNCDGIVDEGDPEGDNPDNKCTVPVPGAAVSGPGYGQCALGLLHCKNGSLSECLPIHEPIDEACNNLDDNCNGKIDEAPLGTCESPFTLYYIDVDNDGYGVSADMGTCLCSADGDIRATNNDDCCDSDKLTNPAQIGSSSSRNDCSSYDWNCDGIEEKVWKSNPAAGCGKNGFYCHSPASGWKNAPPACGETAAYYGGCGSWWGGCDQTTYDLTQQCH